MNINKKIVAIVAISVLARIVVAWGAWWYFANSSNKANDQNTSSAVVLEKVCSDELLGRANTALNSSNINDLKQVYEEVIELPNFQNDQNCTYIAAWYSYVVGDLSKASAYQQRLSKLMLHATDYSSILDPAPLSPEVLGGKISGLKTSADTNDQFQTTEDGLTPEKD